MFLFYNIASWTFQQQMLCYYSHWEVESNSLLLNLCWWRWFIWPIESSRSDIFEVRSQEVLQLLPHSLRMSAFGKLPLWIKLPRFEKPKVHREATAGALDNSPSCSSQPWVSPPPINVSRLRHPSYSSLQRFSSALFAYNHMEITSEKYPAQPSQPTEPREIIIINCTLAG